MPPGVGYPPDPNQLPIDPAMMGAVPPPPGMGPAPVDPMMDPAMMDPAMMGAPLPGDVPPPPGMDMGLPPGPLPEDMMGAGEAPVIDEWVPVKGAISTDMDCAALGPDATAWIRGDTKFCYIGLEQPKGAKRVDAEGGTMGESSGSGKPAKSESNGGSSSEEKPKGK